MGKKRTKTTTHQVTQNTTPTWVQKPIESAADKISTTFAGLDPYSLVAGPDALQTQAASEAAGLQLPAGFGAAQSAFEGVGNGRILDGMGAYRSGYEGDVLKGSLDNFDYAAGQTRAQDALARAGDITFGGSGGAIQTSISNSGLARERALLEAQLRDQAFTRAGTLAGQDVANRLAAASGMAGTASAQSVAERANIAQRMDIGSILQQLAQAKAQAPITALGAQTAMTAGLPWQLFSGSTTDGTGTQTTSGGGLAGAIGAIGGLAQGLGAMGLTFSDRRLKTDIKKLGTRTKDDLGVYTYRYKGEPERHVGVMAQEVAKVKPQAVHRTPIGLLAVDYGAL